MKIGSLFSGYGGLDMGVQAVLGGTVVWHSDIDKGACKVLAHRYPDVPNLGDVTRIDWTQVEPVDVLCGGTPCQDLSHAGKRGGMTEGTRSNLWVAMREAIAALRPPLVVWENVRGAYSAQADSEVEPCAGCMGSAADRGPALRALGRVLGDLSDLGYDAGWHGLRAADVGAPHGRFRVFIAAWDTHGAGLEGRRLRRWGAGERAPRATGGEPAADAAHLGHERGRSARRRGTGPADSDHGPLLPTPAVNDMGEGKTVEAWDEWTARMKAEHANGNGHGKSLAIEAQRLLPTPVATEGRKGQWQPSQHRLDANHEVYLANALYDAHHHDQEWGDYADAIARWEHLTRPAPPPTQPSRKGTPQLSPAFSEWLMGLPAGWVTDTPGITRNEALRALGNGVVPQQAAAALRFLQPVEVPT